MINIKNGPLYQWDLNRLVEIDDPENKVSEIHCCHEGDPEALIIPFSRNGNKAEAKIPNFLLRTGTSICIYVVYNDDSEVRTVEHKIFYVFSREQPSDYVYNESEDPNYNNFAEEIKAQLAGKADLDENGKIKTEQLPDDILKEEVLMQAVDTAIAQAKENGELKGEDGTSVTVDSVTESSADGGNNIVRFSDGTSVTIKNGSKGRSGTDGVDGYTPVKGTDYFTYAEKVELKNEIVAETVTQNTGNSTDKVMSQYAVTKALETLVTLPFGGSKEWLENNGDITKLYHIGGYVWGYVASNGWTKSDVSYLVVSSESQMTNAGGTEYILRNGNTGTVYSYTEASGDIGVPLYSDFPTATNEGDIIAVGDRKYKATLSTVAVEHNAYNPDTAQFNKRLNSSGEERELGGALLLDYAEVEYDTNCVVTVKGISNLVKNYSSYMNIDYYTADKTRIGSITVETCYIPGSWTLVNDAFSGSLPLQFRLFNFNNTLDVSATKYVRIKLGIKADNNNISATDCTGLVVNFSTKNTTESKITWNDIGTYNPPVEAGWNATDETYNVIDTLSAAANNGSSAVYSGDGYVYSYIVGADWVQTSKYNAPTLSIDGELSDSSVNAVQNKKVTEAINDLNAKANTNANEITALNERMAEIETGSNTVAIPSFWQSAVDEAIAKIKALQVGKNCVTFPFFSDNHQRNGYAGILIAHIMKECGIPYCFFGGDTISSGYLTESEMIAQDNAFDTIMSYIPDGRMCRAVGNHDGYWNDNGAKGYYTREKVYELFLRGEGVAQNKHFGEDGTYYYVDDIASKVRFIVLNTNNKVIAAGSESIDSTQLEWLQNTALSIEESGWGVVIISHCPISNHYHANVTNAEEVISAINNSGADIIGWFSGHIHRDRMYIHLSKNGTDGVEGDNYSALDFTEVTITSDNTTISYDDATKHTVANDDLSHAIDFVTINKATRAVNITRLGIGEDRSYTY